MSQTDELRSMIATMLMVAPEDVTPETSLAALNTSLGGARISRALQRLGLSLPANARPATFGALVAAISAGAPAEPAASSSPSAASPRSAGAIAGPVASSGVLLGLDVHEISSLPDALDYWEHEFYRDNFAPSEIAYAVLQPAPRTHFAGFWSAKEALRKCDPLYNSADLASMAVAHDPSGRPYLTLQGAGGRAPLPHMVSISHTGKLAIAIVTSSSPAPQQPAQPAEAAALQVRDAVLEVETAPEPAPAVEKKPRGLARLFG
ncbi:MAG TPA: 4'-phosphopantetheinyl transferase superfamily protein [Acidisarcina sp.]